MKKEFKINVLKKKLEEITNKKVIFQENEYFSPKGLSTRNQEENVQKKQRIHSFIKTYGITPQEVLDEGTNIYNLLISGFNKVNKKYGLKKEDLIGLSQYYYINNNIMEQIIVSKYNYNIDELIELSKVKI